MLHHWVLYPSLAVKYLHSNKNELVQLLPHPHALNASSDEAEAIWYGNSFQSATVLGKKLLVWYRRVGMRDRDMRAWGGTLLRSRGALTRTQGPGGHHDQVVGHFVQQCQSCNLSHVSVKQQARPAQVIYHLCRACAIRSSPVLVAYPACCASLDHLYSLC